MIFIINSPVDASLLQTSMTKNMLSFSMQQAAISVTQTVHFICVVVCVVQVVDLIKFINLTSIYLLFYGYVTLWICNLMDM